MNVDVAAPGWRFLFALIALVITVVLIVVGQLPFLPLGILFLLIEAALLVP